MKLMTYMIFMSEYKQRRGIGLDQSSQYLSLKEAQLKRVVTKLIISPYSKFFMYWTLI